MAVFSICASNFGEFEPWFLGPCFEATRSVAGRDPLGSLPEDPLGSLPAYPH